MSTELQRKTIFFSMQTNFQDFKPLLVQTLHILLFYIAEILVW